MRILTSLLTLGLLATAAGAQIWTPEPGSVLREEVLDAFRAPVEKQLGQQVVFKVSVLRVSDGWAFLNAQPLTKAGQKEIDYSKTKFADDVREGFFDDWLCALAKKKNGRWVVVALEIGATDVPFEPWPEKFGAPRALMFGQ